MGEEAARIRIVQITDVYTLKNFPHVKTLISEKKSEMDELGGKTISMLTGDFLAPYLLSSFDKGQGMVNILNQTPIDYVIWGNHEHDLGLYKEIDNLKSNILKITGKIPLVIQNLLFQKKVNFLLVICQKSTIFQNNKL